jgi:hypothetical protein
MVCRGGGTVVTDDLLVTDRDRILAAEQVQDDIIRRSQYGS